MIREDSYSTLIVSSNEKFNQVLASIMPPDEFSCEVVGNVGEGRRALLERDYDIVIVNTPLPDEFGVNFAIDTGADTNSGVLLCINADLFEEVTDKCEEYGVLTISKPTSRQPQEEDFTGWRRRLHPSKRSLLRSRRSTERSGFLSRILI